MKGFLLRLVLVLLPGVLLLAANGQTKWTALGPDAVQWYDSLAAAGKIGALVVNNANQSVMYAAGGFTGPNTGPGIYKTTDGGTSWVHSDAGVTDPVVNALWLDQTNPKILVAGAGQIFRSTDSGAQWKSVATYGNTTAFLQVGSTLYAATTQGVATSSDEGGNWTIAPSNQTTSNVLALAAGGRLLYAGLGNGQVGVYSAGSWTWNSPSQLPSNAFAQSIAVNPSKPRNAFVVEWSGYSNASLYETKNAGGTWFQVSTPTNCPGPGGSPAQVVAWDSDTSVIYAGCDFAMSQSLDGGTTWTQMSGTGWDVRLVVTDFSGKSGYVAVASDQGLFLSTNAGSTWQSLNGNLKSSILTGLAVHGSTILTTVQDFPPISSFNGGKTWSMTPAGGVPGGEDGVALFNPGDPKYAYIYTATGGFYYSTNGGETFSSVSGLPTAESDGDVIAVDTKNPSTVYVATNEGVFKSVNWGTSWPSQPESGWPSEPIMIAVDPTNSDNIFVGQQDGAIMVSNNAGVSWTTSTVNCANCGWPTSAAIFPENSNIVLVGMSFTPPNGGILVSLDGGSTFNPANSGLGTSYYYCEVQAVNHLRFDPSGSGLIVAATNAGLYSSNVNSEITWTDISANAVPMCFNDVAFANKKLYAATAGEGVLSTPFPN